MRATACKFLVANVLLGCLAVWPADAAAQTRTIVTTLPDFQGPYDSAAPFPFLTVGTFTYTLLPGESVTGAVVSGTWGNDYYPQGSAGADVYLDGILVAQCVANTTCWFDALPDRVPWSYTYGATQLAAFADGKAVMTAQMTSSVVVELGDLRLTLTIDSPPVLTVTGGGTGSGVVTSQPGLSPAIDCTLNNGVATGTCSGTYPSQPTVTLTATPTGGSTFSGWSGPSSGFCSGTTCTLSMSLARAVTASFTAPPPQTLTVAVGGSGSGTVASSPAGISGCSAAAGDCTETYPYGTQVTLTASPATGSSTAWTGCDSVPSANQCVVTMTQARSVAATFADAQAPSVPTGLVTSSVGATSLTLSWTAASDNVGVSTYQVFRGGVFRSTVNAPSVTFSDTGLTAATTYSYTVAACDAAGNCSAQSTSASATTLDNIAPSVPTGLSAAAVSASQINLAWSAATDNVAVSAYQVFRGGVFRSTVNAPSVTFSDTGLTAATTYSYTVAACDAAGNCSAQSAPPASATTQDNIAPSVPTGLTATALSASQINLTWTASTDNVGVTQYKVYRGGSLLVTLGNVTSYSDTSLTAATTYSYTVAACDAAGNCSAQSASASASTPDNIAPSVPTELNATAVSASQINLAWTAATDNVGVTQYRVYRGGTLLVTLGNVTSYSDTALTAATTYSYTVSACDAVGNCSAQSSAASATTPAGSTFTANLESGFNLIGNSLNITLDIPAIFGNQDSPTGITSNIVSLWSWNASAGRWTFYSPQLTAAGIASFAASKGYEVLSTINPGEGYWVNAIGAMTLPTQSGTGFDWTGINFATLPSGFNLIAQANNATPSQFNNNVSATPPSPGVVPTDNFVSLWAWDAVQGKWYFYSPLLESSGGLAAVKAYADTHFYLHFQDYNKKIDVGVGFWVNRP